MLPEWLSAPGVAAPCACGSGGGRHSFIAKTLSSVEAFFHVFDTAESFAARSGFLQSLDPRLKLMTFLVTIVGITLLHHVRPILILYGATLLLARLSHLPLRSLLLRTWIFVPLFTAIMTLPVLLTNVTPGPSIGPVIPAWSWGVLHAPTLALSRPGVWIARLLVLRVATTVSWSLLLLWTTRWNDLLAALQILHVPQALVFTLAMTVRYLIVLVREVEDMNVAIQSRALQTISPRLGRRAMTGAIGALLQKSIQWSEEVFSAMASRGFKGRIVLMARPALGVRDYSWLLFWVGSLVWIWRGGV